MPTATKPYPVALVVEKRNIDTGIKLLVEYSREPKFALLPVDEQELIAEQLMAMNRYSVILGQRVALYGTGE